MVAMAIASERIDKGCVEKIISYISVYFSGKNTQSIIHIKG